MGFLLHKELFIESKTNVWTVYLTCFVGYNRNEKNNSDPFWPIKMSGTIFDCILSQHYLKEYVKNLKNYEK